MVTPPRLTDHAVGGEVFANSQGEAYPATKLQRASEPSFDAPGGRFPVAMISEWTDQAKDLCFSPTFDASEFQKREIAFTSPLRP
jgi:hypothetical protein